MGSYYHLLIKNTTPVVLTVAPLAYYCCNVGKSLCITEEMSDSISDDAISSRSTTLDYDCLIKFLSLGECNIITRYQKHNIYQEKDLQYFGHGLVSI